jgi:hypothetical protein
MKKLFVAALASAALVGACGDDDDGSPSNNGGSSSAGKANDAGAPSDGGMPGGGSSSGGSPTDAGGAGGASTTHFTLTIENIAPTKLYTSSGVFNTPVGDATPGPATPGKKYEFTIDAGRKQKLSFATMLAATNDLFYAPTGAGIALYDEQGEPISGDVTDQVYLWDAGTELNEEPKIGPNTVSKQAAPNTGPDEDGDVVEISDTTDPFDYPSVADVIKVVVTHVAGTQFKISVEDVSAADALKTSGGDFAAPISPGVWVVHNGADPLFTEGKPDRGQGIERIAEDGNPTELGAFAADTSGITFPASPGAWVVHRAGTMPLFSTGKADYGDGVEHIAEDGNPTLLGESLPGLSGFVSGAVFNMPVGKDAPGPILPGAKYVFELDASPGDALSFATMLAATNDVFFGPAARGIPLFDADGAPVTGDVTSEVVLWDAGTEANEMPGIGPNTVTNQSAPDTGEAGEGKVQLLSAVDDGFEYPAVDTLLKVTLSAD